jgi:uncharacterized HAD superfamily protein
MGKQIIAVDIDEVLADTAEGFIAYSNDNFGTNLKTGDFTEHWMDLWQVDHKEMERRARQFHHSGAVSQYTFKEHAKPVLEKLKDNYLLIVITSRNSRIIKETHAWVDEHFAGIFDDIKFAGIFDGPFNEEMLHKTKGELFASNQVNYVIDDQLKHCLAAAKLGVNSILFGDYSWNQAEDLPKLITRCSDWLAVEEYFDARR